jgi:acetolactate synthase-1/2/3 large subunit
MPITKHSFLVTKADDISGGHRLRVPHRRTGRPARAGDITKDALQARPASMARSLDLPGYGRSPSRTASRSGRPAS